MFASFFFVFLPKISVKQVEIMENKYADGISRIEINSLWGRKHIVWDLRPDINILSGVNGTGKSTILTRLWHVWNTLRVNLRMSTPMC